MTAPSQMSLRRIPDALSLRVRIAYAAGWDALIDTHTTQALQFVCEFAPRLPVLGALDLYFRVTAVPEAMQEAVRVGTLTALDVESLPPLTVLPSVAGWQRLRLDLLIEQLQYRRRYHQRTLALARMVGARSAEAVVATHVENAIGFARLLKGIMPVNVATDRYIRDRKDNETFQDVVKRIGKKDLHAMLEDLTHVPPYEVDPSYYSDWGDPREYTIGDMGIGECAGEVVSVAQFALASADRLIFEAQLHLDSGDFGKADDNAYRAMLQAALSLVRAEWPEAPDDAELINTEFRKRFFDTNIWGDRYAGSKFAQYLFIRHGSGPNPRQEQARRLVEEAQLFVEAVNRGHDILTERAAR